MNFLTKFIFDGFDKAMSAHQKIFQLGNKNKYITYRQVYEIIYGENSIDKNIEIYNKYGWTNLIRLKPINGEQNGTYILEFPQIENLENVIKYRKEENNNE